MKKRAMPPKPSVRHDICDTCSHKFFVKMLYEEYAEKIASRDQEIRSREREYDERKQQFLGLRKEYNERKTEVW
jgi:hypothetical protein